jgi:hypothetical protein
VLFIIGLIISNNFRDELKSKVEQLDEDSKGWILERTEFANKVTAHDTLVDALRADVEQLKV